MKRHLHAFTLIELLIVIAIIGILAAILFPVFAQARGSARQASCLSNCKQTAAAALMYSQDFDETFPRVDNNGDCAYDPIDPCQLPDFDQLTLAPGESVSDGSVFFLNVIEPYVQSYEVFVCPEIGTPDYQDAINNITQSDGYHVDLGAPYSSALTPIYAGGIPQISVNSFVIDWNIYWPWFSTNPQDPSFIPQAHGRLAGIARPADTVLFVGEQAFNYTQGEQYGVGFPFTWPLNVNSLCADLGSNDNWYVHKGSHQQDPNWYPYEVGSESIPEWSGWTTVAFCDGHAKAFRFNELERCDFDQSDNYWIYTHWDPTF